MFDFVKDKQIIKINLNLGLSPRKTHRRRFDWEGFGLGFCSVQRLSFSVVQWSLNYPLTPKVINMYSFYLFRSDVRKAIGVRIARILANASTADFANLTPESVFALRVTKARSANRSARSTPTARSARGSATARPGTSVTTSPANAPRAPKTPSATDV